VQSVNDDVGFHLLLPIAVIIVAYFLRVPEAQRRALFVNRTALFLTVVVTSLVTAFVIGETLADPGGWTALGLIASWLVPLLLFSALAWWRPAWMLIPVLLLSLAMVALAVWFAVDAHWWRDLEDRVGPVRTIAMFVVATAIACFAWRRPAAGGALLLTATAVPMLVVQFALRGSFSSLGTALMTIASPYVVIALLYLGSALVASSEQPGRRTRVSRPA
jgi:hypothetical protein